MTTLGTAVQAFIDQSFNHLNTVRVAKVISFKQDAAGAPHVEVQPLMTDRAGSELPIIVRVPVVYPMSTSQQVGVAYSLAVDDYVLLLFNQVSLDEWLSFGGDQEPHDVRRFDLSDAIAVPGVVPLNNNFIDLSTPNYICVGDVSSTPTALRLEISPTEKIKLGNGTASGDVLKILSELLLALSNTVVATALGPQPLSSAAQMGVLKIYIDSIKGVA